MPIANCYITTEPPSAQTTNSFVSRWADEAGVSGAQEHMTVNFIRSTAQCGKPYPAMAWLYLPSMWPPDDIEQLQNSLARVLAKSLNVPLANVQVFTTIIQSGLVVEEGQTVHW